MKMLLYLFLPKEWRAKMFACGKLLVVLDRRMRYGYRFMPSIKWSNVIDGVKRHDTSYRYEKDNRGKKQQ